MEVNDMLSGISESDLKNVEKFTGKNLKGAKKMDNQIRQAIGTMMEVMNMSEKEAFLCMISGFKNGSQKHESADDFLKSVTTKQLHEELLTRGGVEEFTFTHEEILNLEKETLGGAIRCLERDNGPLRVIVNKD